MTIEARVTVGNLKLISSGTLAIGPMSPIILTVSSQDERLRVVLNVTEPPAGSLLNPSPQLLAPEITWRQTSEATTAHVEIRTSPAIGETAMAPAKIGTIEDKNLFFSFSVVIVGSVKRLTYSFFVADERVG